MIKSAVYKILTILCLIFFYNSIFAQISVEYFGGAGRVSACGGESGIPGFFERVGSDGFQSFRPEAL